MNRDKWKEDIEQGIANLLITTLDHNYHIPESCQSEQTHGG